MKISWYIQPVFTFIFVCLTSAQTLDGFGWSKSI